MISFLIRVFVVIFFGTTAS